MPSQALGSPGAVPVVVLFYPCRSLVGQIKEWLERHGGHVSRISFARSLPEIRRRMRRADTVIVDASEDEALASDAFLQAILVMGSGATAVYTERTAEEMERFVRRFGAPFLLGPMSLAEWEAYFQRQQCGISALSDSEVPAEPVAGGGQSVRFPAPWRRAA
jgi:hypothetical protein